MTYRNKRLLEACRELPCQHCGAEDGTVVAAHSNWASEGKARSLKAKDSAVASLCFACHSQIDQGKDMTRAERREMWIEAHCKTLRALIEIDKLRVH